MADSATLNVASPVIKQAGPSQKFKLLGFQLSSGENLVNGDERIVPTAFIAIDAGGTFLNKIAIGRNINDAIANAIERLTGIRLEMVAFRMWTAMHEGRVIYNTNIRFCFDKRSGYRGRAGSEDQDEAIILAFLQVANEVAYEREEEAARLQAEAEKTV